MKRLPTAVASARDPDYKKMLEDIDAFEKKTKHITDVGPKCFVCEKGVPVGRIRFFSNQRQFYKHMYYNHRNYFDYIRKSTRHGAKPDSSPMIIDEPSTSAIEMDEEPSTNEHLLEIDDEDRETYQISELHEYQYY
uniref:Uncharacterized protein LOC113795196 n=1 Tax=Dermatophagoides pteronyssinus TaxID=6956 RepID=A0A6P6Y9D1_DERPT|nr:uncharacterized protein LOC113795196 [Dermatophagoides pteronyssinus]